MPSSHMVGHYRMVRSLGQGGMGEVFIAIDEKLKRNVAIKSIRADHRFNEAAKQRFLREARILSSLDHPYICKIFDYIEEDDGDYLVLEFIEGETLAVEAQRDLDLARRMRIAEQMAEALVAAHAEGIVHRDLKPMNVMVMPSGDIRVLDFGLAHSGVMKGASSSESAPLALDDGDDDPDRTIPISERDAIAPYGDHFHTVAGRITGTPYYMSPEQASGDFLTAASDMYSYGLILQYLFTGRLPYEDDLDTSLVIEKAKRGETLPLERVSRDLRDLIDALKSHAPSRRPTAEQVLQRLRWIRDKPRRRLRRILIAALVFISIGAGLKYTLDLRHERGLAVTAQREAERRRDQAEDLISFMLGDLRSRLEPVGRLDVLDAVGDKALDYFASLPESDLDDDELFRRSTALRQIGEVRLADNDLPAASRAFEESLVLSEGLVRRDATNGEWQMGLGASEFWLGNVRWLQLDMDGALAHFRTYKTISETLVALDADNPTYQLELSYGYTNLGAVHQQQGRLDLALPAIRESIRIKTALLEADPENGEYRTSLANGLSWLSSVQLQSGDLTGALGTLQDELARREAICADDPRDMDAKYLLETCHIQNGQLHMFLGQVEEARDQYLREMELTRELTAHDPANKEWARDFAVNHMLLADVQIASDDLEGALGHLETSERLLLDLVKNDPTNIERRIDLGALLNRQCAVALEMDDLQRAEQYAKRTSALIERMRSEEAEGRRLTQIEAAAHLNRGRVLAALDRSEEAAAAWQRALATIEPLTSDASDPEACSTKAIALLCLRRTDEAQPIVDDLWQRGYRKNDFVRMTGRSTLDPEAAEARMDDSGR